MLRDVITDIHYDQLPPSTLDTIDISPTTVDVPMIVVVISIPTTLWPTVVVPSSPQYLTASTTTHSRLHLTTVSSTTDANTTTTTYVPTTPFFTTTAGLFDSQEGKAILGLLIAILVILVALPLLFYILARKCCWIKVTPSGQSQLSHGIPSTTDRNKKIQTDVSGKDMEDLFRKRQPTNVLEYKGKVMESQEMPARIKPVNPNTWNDPWSSKFPRDHHYITRLED